MAATLTKKLLIGLAAAAGTAVVLVAVLVFIVSSGVATKRAVDLVLPRVSKALGREVTLRGAELKIFPNPRVKLGGLVVAGRPGEPALVEAESLDVEVGLWPLLRSLGKDVEVRAFTLVKPSVNLVRAKDGTWNHEGLGPPSPPEKAPAPEARPPEPEGGGARVAVQTVRIEDAAIRVIDRTLGRDDPGIALADLDLEAHGVGPGLPFDARLDAALADERQNVHAQLSVAKLPSGVPQAPADWPAVQGSVTLGALALDRIRALLPGELGAILRGGTASLDARLTTSDGPSYQVDGAGELRDVRLRGQAAAGRFRAAAAWSPAKPDAAKIDVTDLALKGPGVDLGGRLSVDTAPLRAWFALAGPLLDLDAVMGVLPEAPAQPQVARASTAPQGEVVPEATRRQIQGATARGTIAIGKLKGGRLEATDVKARAVLSKGTLTLEQLDAAVFGGRVSAAGTQVSLAEKEPTWKLAANLSQLDLGQATTAFAGKAPLLAKVDGTLEVAGAGTEWEKLRDAVTGIAALALKDGTLTTTDLGDEVLGALAKGLEAAGRGGLAKRLAGAKGGKTTFKDLGGKFTVKDGFLSAASPFELGSDVGKVTLGGRIGLDGRLDLQGGVAVPRKVLQEVVSGVPLPETLDVPLGLGGDLGAPRVSVRADEAVKGILRGQVQEARKAVRQEAERAARKGVEDLLDRFGKKRK
jgi:AsmA protein